MHILKKGVPFCWDEVVQCSFEALKHTLTSTPLLWPPDYTRYFLLYLVVVESTISMVLVQEDDLLEEHVIYYLFQGLVGPELNYSHVEKLSLAAVHAVQRFCHYIFASQDHFHCRCEPFPICVNMTGHWWKYQYMDCNPPVI
jgi:hypothetical protein